MVHFVLLFGVHYLQVRKKDHFDRSSYNIYLTTIDVNDYEILVKTSMFAGTIHF